MATKMVAYKGTLLVFAFLLIRGQNALDPLLGELGLEQIENLPLMSAEHKVLEMEIEEKDCKDLQRQCPEWAELYYCTVGRFQQYMHANCPLSCGKCPELSPMRPSVENPYMDSRCNPNSCPQPRCVDSVLHWEPGRCCPICKHVKPHKCEPYYKQNHVSGVWYNGKICKTITPIITSACAGYCASSSYISIATGNTYPKCECCEVERTSKFGSLLECYTPHNSAVISYEIIMHSIITSCHCHQCPDYTGPMMQEGVAASHWNDLADVVDRLNENNS